METNYIFMISRARALKWYITYEKILKNKRICLKAKKSKKSKSRICRLGFSTLCLLQKHFSNILYMVRKLFLRTFVIYVWKNVKVYVLVSRSENTSEYKTFDEAIFKWGQRGYQNRYDKKKTIRKLEIVCKNDV